MTISTRTTRNRLAIATLATVAVLGSAGPAGASPGRSTATGDEASASPSALLLDGRSASRVLGDDVTTTGTSNRLARNSSIRPAQCASTYAAGLQSAYGDAAPVSVAAMTLEGRSASVEEYVVQLSDKGESSALLKSTADAWAECGGTIVSSTNADGETQSWQLDEPRVNGDHTIVSLAQRRKGGSATCERAIAAFRDVFFDVMTCRPDGSNSGTAVAVVDAIGQRAQSQTT